MVVVSLGVVVDNDLRKGCGPVGLMAQIIAHNLGAKRIIAVDHVAERLSMAAKLGSVTINFEQCKDVPGEINRICPGGVDVSIEAVGFRYSASWTHGISTSVGLEYDSIEALSTAIRSTSKG